MDEQLNFLDVYGSLADQSEESIIRSISKETGLKFTRYEQNYKYYGQKRWYRSSRGKVQIEIDFDTYFNSCQMFIGVEYTIKGPSYKGGGGPCDSIEEAVSHINKILQENN